MKLRAGVFTAAATLAGAATGAVLGGVGSLAPPLAGGAAVAAGIGIAVLGWLESGNRLRLPMRNIETPQRWLDQGVLWWAAKNGTALGFGAGTRTGFLVWYLVPAGALLSRHAVLGAALYGAYGLVRAGSVYVWLFGAKGEPLAAAPQRVLAFKPVARRASALLCMAVGAAVLASALAR